MWRKCSIIRFLVLINICALMSTDGKHQAQSQELPGPLQTFHIDLHGTGITLSEVVKEISRLSGCKIIVNDHPNGGKTDINFVGTLPKVLKSISDKFGYQYNVTRTGVVLFTKRYKDPDDYPNLPWQEISRMAQDMAIATTSIYISPELARGSDIISDFKATLTPAQLDQFKGEAPVYVKQLSKDQQSLVQEHVTRSLLLVGGEAWGYMAMNFDALPKSSVRLGLKKSESPVENNNGQVGTPPSEVNDEYELFMTFTTRDGLVICLPFGPISGIPVANDQQKGRAQK